MTRRAALAGAVVVAVAVVIAIVLVVVRSGVDGSDAAQPAALDRPADFGGYLSATGAAVVAVSTYDYRSLPAAVQAGLQVTGGSYRRAYRAALTGSGATQAIRTRTVQRLDLRAAGVGAITGTQATVFVFGVQRVTSTAGNSARPITLTATVDRVAGRYLITGLVEDANAGLPPGSTGLRQAAETARREIGYLLTYRRAHFAADAARALGVATGDLRDQLAARSRSIRAGLDKGHYDLRGAVTAVAVRSVSASAVTMLVAAEGRRIGADGSQAVVTDGRYAVTVVRTAAGWRVRQITGYGS